MALTLVEDTGDDLGNQTAADKIKKRLTLVPDEEPVDSGNGIFSTIKKTAETPIVPIRELAKKVSPISPEVLKSDAPYAYGYARALARTGETLTEPENVALMLASAARIPKAAKQIASGGFGALMAKELPGLYKQYQDALARDDKAAATELGTMLVTQGLFSVLGLHGAFAGEGVTPIRSRSITPEEATHFDEMHLKENAHPYIPPERQLPLDSKATGKPIEQGMEPQPGQLELLPKRKLSLVPDVPALPAPDTIYGDGFTAKNEISPQDLMKAKLDAAFREGIGQSFTAEKLGLLNKPPELPWSPADPKTPIPMGGPRIPPERQIEGPPVIEPETKTMLEDMTGKPVEKLRKEILTKERKAGPVLPRTDEPAAVAEQPSEPEVSPVTEPIESKAAEKPQSVSVPDKALDDLSVNKHGKPFDKLTSTQARDVLAQHNEPVGLPEKNALKIAGKKSFDNTWQEGAKVVFALDKNGKYVSDGRILLIDKDVAGALRDNFWSNQAKEKIKLLTDRQGMSYPEAEAAANAEVQKRRSATDQAPPPYDNVIPKEPGEKGQYVGAQSLRQRFGKGIVSMVYKTKSGVFAAYDAAYIKLIKSYFPDAELFIKDEKAPAKIVSEGKLKGVLMPVEMGAPEALKAKTKWPSEAGAVINPFEVAEKLVEMAKKATSFRDFREKVAADADLNDTARSYALDLRSVYEKKGDKETAASLAALKRAASTASIPEGEFKYVDPKPLEINVTADPKATSKDIRQAYSGAKNVQTLRAVNLAADIRKAVPDPIEREALTLMRDAPREKLEAALTNPKFKDYLPAINLALNPTEAMQKGAPLLEKYFKETGQVGNMYGFLNELRDNYINRIYDPEPPDTKIKTETSRSGLPKSTYHSKQRVFPTILDAIEYGKKPSTLDAADLLSIHGQEFSKVLNNNKLIQVLNNTGLGAQIESGKLPPGYVRLGNSNFAVPDWLAGGLKAITEPNFVRRIDSIRGIQKYQGLVKSVDLSLSFFHHFTMAMQVMYETKFGLEALRLAQFAKNASFREIETDFVEHTGMVENIDANREIIRRLAKGNSFLDRAVRAPGIKPMFDLMEKNNEFLFGKMQRWFKVMNYGKSLNVWLEKHPDASNLEVKIAKRGIAKQINAAYGGLNWEAMGATPSMVAAARLILLAPDWTTSNIALLKYAGQGGEAGNRARTHLASAVIGGAILTEGLNKMITGHYTNKNPDGHKLEVQVRPGVYVSFFRGGIGDTLKWANTVKTYGPGVGTARFFQSKTSPFVREGISMMTNVDKFGRRIVNPKKPFASKVAADLTSAGKSMVPVPFNIPPGLDMLSKNEPDVLGAILVASGIGTTDRKRKK